MEKSKFIAGVLALAGGVFGIHKFYLNDPGSGIFYTMLSIFSGGYLFMPIGAMLGVIDAIRLFTMSEAAFDAKYNKNRPARSKTRKSNNRATGRRESRQSREVQVLRQRNENERIAGTKRSNPFRKSADQKFKEYDLEGALQDYERAAEISPADKKVYFNKACIYSLMEKTDKSLEQLEKAIELGFNDEEKIKSIDELAFLRIQPEFEAFVANGYKRTTKSKAVEPPKGDLLQDDLLLSQLNKLKELRSRGLLSEKEFSYEKEKLLRK